MNFLTMQVLWDDKSPTNCILFLFYVHPTFFSHCTLCRISFTSWWSLLKHKSLNLNLISSPCKYCEVMFIDRQNPKKHKYTSYITLTYLGSQLGKVNGTTRQLIMFFGFYPQLPNLKAHPTAHNLNMSQKKS